MTEAPAVESETTMQEISRLASEYAKKSEAALAIAQDLHAERTEALRRVKPKLEKVLADRAAAKSNLKAAIEAAPKATFAGGKETPRERIIDGVKVGRRKQPGRIDGDTTAALTLIPEKLSDQASQLLKTTVTLDKTALRDLSAAQLASVSLKFVAVADKTIIQLAKSDLEKMVDALQKGFDDEMEKQS